MDIEIRAGNGAGNHVFLNLNQIVIGVSHAENRQHVAAARNDNQGAGPLMLIGHTGVAEFDGGRAADNCFAPRNHVVIGINFAQAFFHGVRADIERIFGLFLANHHQSGFVGSAHGYDGVGQSFARVFNDFPTGRFVHAESVGKICVESALHLLFVGGRFGFFGSRRRL